MNFCKNCGREIADKTEVCPTCGFSCLSYQRMSESLPVNNTANGLANASLFCGIFGLVCIPITSIPAIICAIVAKKKGNTSGKATAGLVTGIIGIGLLAVLLLILILEFGIIYHDITSSLYF